MPIFRPRRLAVHASRPVRLDATAAGRFYWICVAIGATPYALALSCPIALSDRPASFTECAATIVVAELIALVFLNRCFSVVARLFAADLPKDLDGDRARSRIVARYAAGPAVLCPALLIIATALSSVPIMHKRGFDADRFLACSSLSALCALSICWLNFVRVHANMGRSSRSTIALATELPLIWVGLAFLYLCVVPMIATVFTAMLERLFPEFYRFPI